ncbi:MAG: hypothetical protein HC830_00970 [Bacteroidetes bacterium]|nr:hypothetical protein [Bacteroidota bacterium]
MKKLTIYLLLVLFFMKITAQTYPGKIGIGLSGIGGFTMEFVDAAKPCVHSMVIPRMQTDILRVILV